MRLAEKRGELRKRAGNPVHKSIIDENDCYLHFFLAKWQHRFLSEMLVGGSYIW
ncbi:hypothetical protein CPter91_1644 [Collimonas pratensis]|uniref:Uncharacterized protein n=1 Tax=Collimonas pratensis TaxID=279113 RepID=A0A127Q1Q3_9BURK|nr:hypothetical protein CPter91_1644 [Collimonas pratensis]